MPLPTLVTPEFRTKIPSTGKQIKFRPFLVKEEKILLMAAESGEAEDLVDATKQILENCLLTKVDIDTLASFDVEYLFLKLRAKSVGEQIEISLRHADTTECDHISKVEVDIDNITIDKINPDDKVIMLNDKMGIKMKYPTINETIVNVSPSDIDSLLELISKCIECVFEEDAIYDDFTIEEMKDFINNFSTKQLERITDFIENMPKLEKEVKYTCKKCGKEESYTLQGLESFFT